MNEETATPTDPTPEKPRKGWGAVVWLWTKRLLLGVLVLFLLVSFLFQIPAVQNWLAHRITNSLSTTLQTRVELDYVRFAYFDKLRLEGLFVEDVYGDTLLYGRELYADLNLNPFVLLSRGLEVEAVELHGARFNIRRDVGAAASNLEIALERLFPAQDPNRERRPFRMNLSELYLNDVQFIQNDSVRGERLSVYLNRGNARLNALDIPQRLIDVASLELFQPIIRIDQFPDHPNQIDRATAASIDSLTRNLDDTVRLRVLVDDFQLTEGRFSLHNYRKSPVKTTPVDQLDFQHLDVYDIRIAIDGFQYFHDTFQANVNQIALREVSGFELNKLSVADASISPSGIQLNGLSLVTPRSELGDTLYFRYSEWADWADFNDEVRMDARLHNAQVALSDIMTFVPALQRNLFFRSNRDAVMTIDGRVSGQVNNLRGRDLNLSINEGTTIAGNFSSRNLAVPNEEFLNLRLDQLRTNIRTLRQLIPRFDPPANFDRLGTLSFSGNFDGFLADFVAFGELRTAIGRARMDMRMNLKPGVRRATYSGGLQLINFDLAAWSGNDDFGIVNFTSTVKNGVGLVAETASAELTAEIESFPFRDYTYRNANLTGQLNRNSFDGDFAIQDENIDLTFQGKVNFRDSVPVFDFQADVRELDMLALNLSNQDIVLSGNIALNLRNTQFSKMVGQMEVRNFRLIKDRTDEYEIGAITASSTFADDGRKVFRLDSDIAEGEVIGFFDLDELPGSLRQFLVTNYPGFASRLKITAPTRTLSNNRFTYRLHVLDSKGLNWLISPKLGRLEDVRLMGSYDGVTDSLVVDLEMPVFRYGDLELKSTILQLDALRDEGELEMVIDSIYINDKPTFGRVIVLNLVDADSLTFFINYDGNRGEPLGTLNLNGYFYLHDSTHYAISFMPSDLTLMREPWKIDADNTIVFGKDYIETKNFALTSGNRSIILENYGERGLALNLDNLQFGLIDSVWQYQALNFAGNFDLNAQIEDIFRMQGIKAAVESDTLLINGDDFGRLRVDVEAPDLRGRALAYLSITRDTAQLIAKGFLNLADQGERTSLQRLVSSQRKNYFDLAINVNGFPFSIAEYWLGDGISQSLGSFNANLRLQGMPERPDVSGDIAIRRASLLIDFLQTRYTIDQAFVSVNNYLFDATGSIVKDDFNNIAYVTGGISHNHLRDLGLQARLRTRRFLGFDLERSDDQPFYGRAFGSGDVRFSGSFEQPEIYVNATIGDSTRIIIPVAAQADAGRLDNVRFESRSQPTPETNELERANKLTGLSLEMDLTVTDEAVMELVFDEQAGDLIRGTGRGNIRMLLPRSGDFQMFGDYTISQGNYLFTLYNVINKDFRIRPGGRIAWTGDPFGARISLEAEYKDLKAPLATFIPEYIVNAPPSVLDEARNATDVDLTLQLEGELQKPTINFDIEFPNLQGQLESYAENKMRLLRQDQNELNRQVFGLIVVGQFLPSDFTFSGGEVIANTLSEYFSNQFSLLLTELFSDIIGEDNVLSGINFDVAYNQYTTTENIRDQNRNFRGNEFALTIRQNFLDDRLTVQVGGNVDFGNTAATTAPEAAGAFVGNDIVIEYALNDVRTLKLRVYQRLEPNIGGGRRLQLGAGLSWRKEFNSFSDFWKSLRKGQEN